MENYYNKWPLWQWIILYIIIGALAYGAIYYFWFYRKGGYDNSQNGSNQIISYGEEISSVENEPITFSTGTLSAKIYKQESSAADLLPTVESALACDVVVAPERIQKITNTFNGTQKITYNIVHTDQDYPRHIWSITLLPNKMIYKATEEVRKDFLPCGTGSFVPYKVNKDWIILTSICQEGDRVCGAIGDEVGTTINFQTVNKNKFKIQNMNVDILQEGTGEAAKNGDTVTVNYTGTLTDGTKFDSSLNPGRTPFEFTINVSSVIQGWHLGVTGMKVGEKRKLTIPPDLGYGPAGRPPVIPQNATLIFEIELLKIN